jgi:hypothetical protein
MRENPCTMRDSEKPKPQIARLAEALAEILEIQTGRLELQFRDGHLEIWWVHHRRKPADLAEYDDRAAWLAEPPAG